MTVDMVLVQLFPLAQAGIQDVKAVRVENMTARVRLNALLLVDVPIL